MKAVGVGVLTGVVTRGVGAGGIENQIGQIAVR